jgi:hypothetical protein
MVSEALKLALRLKLDQLEDDVAVGFAWTAQDLAQLETEAEAHGLVPPPTIGVYGRRRSSRGRGSAISTGGRTIMRGHG